jgi:hypothetical protein
MAKHFMRFYPFFPQLVEGIVLNLLILGVFISRFLTPRLTEVWKTLQVTAALLSLSLLSAYMIGQTSILSTVLLALAWHLLTQFKKDTWLQPGLKQELILGSLLWLLSAKPSVGLLLGFLLLGFKAWRALITAAFLCLLTCILTSPHLGGWTSWPGDYLKLVGAYYPDGLGAFMGPGVPPHILTNLFGFLAQIPSFDQSLAHAVCKNTWLIGLSFFSLAAFLHWIRPSFFLKLGIVWFLLFCPHVAATEDWLIVLALAENPNKQRRAHGILLLGLTLAIVNLRQGVFIDTMALAWLAKAALLFYWMLRERYYLLKLPHLSDEN